MSAVQLSPFSKFQNHPKDPVLILSRVGLSVTEASRTAIAKDPILAVSIIDITKNLIQADLLTQENIDAILSEEPWRAWDLREMIEGLAEKKLLTQKTFDVIRTIPEDCISVIRSLSSENLLIQENFDAFTAENGKYIKNIAKAVSNLVAVNFLNQENFTLVAVRGREYAEDVSGAICLLSRSEFLTPEYRKIVMTEGGAHAKVIVRIVLLLSFSNLLNSSNLYASALACNGMRAERFSDYVKSKSVLVVDQSSFDQTIRKIEELEVDLIARTLGGWNGRLSEDQLELRIPQELIGEAAEIGTCQGKPGEYAARAAFIAEEEEWNLLESTDPASP